MEKTWVQSAVQHGLRAVQSSVHLTDLLGTLLEWNSRSGVRSLQWVGRAADTTSCHICCTFGFREGHGRELETLVIFDPVPVASHNPTGKWFVVVL